MKKLVLLISLICIGNIAFAECGCHKQTKCLDLITSMHDERATLYNVLNLSPDQQKCKDVIDKMRYDELGKEFQQYEQEKFVLSKMCEHTASKFAIKKQEKVVKNLEDCMKKTSNKYDKELKSVLNSEQRAKLRTIRKMQKKEIKYCQKNKAFYKKDPNLRPFGQFAADSQIEEKLCPVHQKWHMFGFKHNNN